MSILGDIQSTNFLIYIESLLFLAAVGVNVFHVVLR